MWIQFVCYDIWPLMAILKQAIAFLLKCLPRSMFALVPCFKMKKLLFNVQPARLELINTWFTLKVLPKSFI
jgi:hypothetical protein